MACRLDLRASPQKPSTRQGTQVAAKQTPQQAAPPARAREPRRRIVLLVVLRGLQVAHPPLDLGRHPRHLAGHDICRSPSAGGQNQVCGACACKLGSLEPNLAPRIAALDWQLGDFGAGASRGPPWRLQILGLSTRTAARPSRRLLARGRPLGGRPRRSRLLSGRLLSVGHLSSRPRSTQPPDGCLLRSGTQLGHADATGPGGPQAPRERGATRGYSKEPSEHLGQRSR